MFTLLFYTLFAFNYLQFSSSSSILETASSSYYGNFPRLLLRNATLKTLKIIGNSIVTPNGEEIQTFHNFNLNLLAKNLATNCREYYKENCFSDVDLLDFSDNSLTECPSNFTKLMFKHIKLLNLSGNAIKSLLPQKDFASMLARNTLHTLDLSSNQLTTIDEETFKHLKSLKYLNLANNQIKFINLFAFSADTHNLVELDLSRNQIVDTSMEFLLFSSLTKLKYLNMNRNKLSTLSNHLLYNLYGLEYLSLSRNNLKTFDLFSLNTKNNEFLKVLDLSFNMNLKLDYEKKENLQPNEENDEDDSGNVNNIQVLNIAGVDLSYSNLNIFLNNLFEQFINLENLNISSAKIKTLWSTKWPRSIKTIDISKNYIEQFDCEQFEFKNETLNLNSILLNSNRLSDFKLFMNSCSNMLKHQKLGLTIDLSSNLFEKIESIKTSTSRCPVSQNMSSLILKKNPFVCDCEENSWWSNIEMSNNISKDLFEFNENVCFVIKNYEQLRCSSVSESKWEHLNENSNTRYSPQAYTFGPIRNSKIAPILVCPYKYSCSTKTCECCGFRACDCSFHCPLSCKCTRDYSHTFDMVNCTSVNLNIIPSYLPMSTTEILLDNNNLKKIQPYQFFGRFRVRKIDLSLNQLAFLEENSFHGLNQLSILSLSYNHLQILLGYEFKDLFLLEELYLDHNRIQFISNITFSSLINLKLISLQHNNLKHLVEREFFFQFNLNLLNITLDSSFHAIEADNNQIKLIESLKNSKKNKEQKFFKGKEESNKTLLFEKNFNSNMTFFNLIKKMLNTKTTSYLIECIFDRFKELAEDQHDLSESEIVSLNLNTKINDQYLKMTLLRHFKQLKSICNQSLTGISESNRLNEQNAIKMMSLSQIEGENLNDYNFNLNEVKLKEEKDTNSVFFRIKSSLIVLNYSTIFWCFLTIIVVILFFSLLFAFCLIRFHKKKRIKKIGLKMVKKKAIFESFRRKISKLFNRFNRPDTREEEEDEISKSQRIYNKKQCKYLLDNPKLKFKNNNVNRIKLNNPTTQSDVNSNETSDSLRSSSIESSSTKIFDETSSEGYTFNRTTSGLFHSHIWEKDFFQLKTDSNLTSEEMPTYDLFLVYNKFDKDLVENMIAPCLQARPYNYRIVLQHEKNTCHNYNASLNRSKELIAWNHTHTYYNLNLIENFVDLINSSSFVLFVLSKNLFTELEYRLSIETPKHKKLVLLTDDIHDSIAENLLQPGQIFKGNFNSNDQNRKILSLDINDETKKKDFNQDFIPKNTRLLKLSNSLSNQSSFHAYKNSFKKYPKKT